MSSFSLLYADQELNLQAGQLSLVGLQKQINLWPPHTWLEPTQRVECERSSLHCCSCSNPRQHLMHRIIKHHFTDLPYQKTCLVWQHWMNLQPGNEDWCSPRTPKRPQQTKHKEISARKPNTRKWTYPFPWHTASEGKHWICWLLLHSQFREKTNCSVNQLQSSKQTLKCSTSSFHHQLYSQAVICMGSTWDWESVHKHSHSTGIFLYT